MRTIALVARAVFKESVRDRVPYSMVIFAVLLMAASYLISQLTAGQDLKIIKDLGLAAISVFGLLIATFIGIGLVAKEVERRSIFAILSKPVTRGQLILGKYAGLVMTLVVNVALMTVAYYGALWFMDLTTPATIKAAWPAPALDLRLLVAIVLIVAELALVTAIALFFSTFSSPLLSAVFTLGLWVAGHFNSDLRNLENVVDSAGIGWIGRVMYYLLPNLAPFDVKAEVVYGQPVSPMHVGLTLLYGAVYVSVLLLAAHAIFRQRDFT